MTNPPVRIGVLTSGGDAQGMNAAVRAVVRGALTAGAQPYAIYEGYQGLIDGGDRIRPFGWDDVSGILHKGGTKIGTFRCLEFKERDGQLRAAKHLLEHGIDRLVIIGGDGSLTGADTFRTNWPSLVAELVESGEVSPELADAHPMLMIAGLVGSIDNDFVGSDMTIGADTALHRIVSAMDALSSTAASHQRGFVVEVMGRHCGYLALMAAVAGGADFCLIPENPPDEGWEDVMCDKLRRGRAAGRRESMVVVAEGATDRQGNKISADYVKQVLRERLNEDARVTILGHVQRGGSPSAYDRWCSTWLGHEAAMELVNATPDSTPHVIGIRGNRTAKLPLRETVQATLDLKEKVDRGDFDAALDARGASFADSVRNFHQMTNPNPSVEPKGKRIAIVHGGGLAPGMNPAVRAAVRLGLARGYTMLGVDNSFVGLADNCVRELKWEDVEGWTDEGGCYLGTKRWVPGVEHLYSINRTLETNEIDALLVIGGYNAYEAAYMMVTEQTRYPSFNIPIVCVPASIDNNLPGSELSIGCDTTLNVIVQAIDQIKMSGQASTRSFIVEVMGRNCGYLAMMSGLAGGAERIYLPETGITLSELAEDVAWLQESFRAGRKIYLAVRNENADPHYTTDFIARLLEGESKGTFDVRQAVLGHVQQGGIPTPFDRLLATRLTSRALTLLDERLDQGSAEASYIGIVESEIAVAPLAHMPEHVDAANMRPKDEWWLQLADLVAAVSDPRGAGLV